jgi:iron-sulfur cluster repair protein YtfE (RIC family)
VRRFYQKQCCAEWRAYCTVFKKENDIMSNFTAGIIREIAAESPAATRVFEEYKIDFGGGGGGRKFNAAGEIAGVAPAIVNAEIERVSDAQLQNAESPPKRRSVSELIDYILETHRVFTKQELARLPGLLKKVCRKDGIQHQELFALQAFIKLRNFSGLI